MAKFEPKDNTGTLFRNERREKDTHPHATGTAIIDGVAFWVSAWTKEGKNGKFQSLAFRKKEEKTPEGIKRNPGKLAEDDLDSDVPF
jgi:hypothetical protein